MPKQPFTIDVDDEAEDDLKAIRRYDRKKIVDAIEENLSHEPTKISGSTIKKMEQPFWSQYRLRVEEFRVYYDVDEPNQTVFIVRVLFKGTKTTRKRKKSS